MLTYFKRAFFVAALLILGISQFAWAQQIDDLHYLFPALNGNLKQQVPDVTNLAGGYAAIPKIAPTTNGFRFYIEARGTIQAIVVNNPPLPNNPYPQYYKTTNYDFPYPERGAINPASNTNIHPGAFQVGGLIYEITNSYLPAYHKQIVVQYQDHWGYNNDFKEVFSENIANLSEFDSVLPKSDVRIEQIRSAFKAHIVQKGALQGAGLISRIRTFVVNKNKQIVAEANSLARSKASTANGDANNSSSSNNSSSNTSSSNNSSSSRNTSSNTSYTNRSNNNTRANQGRQRVDDHNNAIQKQANSVYQQSQNTWNAYQKTLKDIDNAFNGGVDYNKLREQEALDDERQYQEEQRQKRQQQLEKERQDREYRRQQAEQQRIAEEKARVAAEKAGLERTRKNIFVKYPAGALPNSGSFIKSNNLFYFVYAYGALNDYTPQMYISNVFAVGKYPDGTWPLEAGIVQEINNLTGYNEVLHGSYTSEYDAQNALLNFKSALASTGMQLKEITYVGKNAHATTVVKEGPKLDAWGNPIKEGVSKSGNTGAASGKVKLDAWGNPIKDKSTGQKADTTQTKKKVKLDEWGNPIKHNY